MKTKLILFAVLTCLWGFIGCDDNENIPVDPNLIESTQDGSSVFILEGYENPSAGYTLFQPEGFDRAFYIQDKQFAGSAYLFAEGQSGRLSDMGNRPADGQWQETMTIVAGHNYWARYKGLTEYTFLKIRVAYVSGNNVGLEYIIEGTEARDLSENVNRNVATDESSVTNVEIPALNAANRYVAHYVELEGNNILNYALEWDNTNRHAAWVAFSFDETTCQDNVSRTDAWDVDPELPADMQTSNDQHRNDGFDRGHLVASEDRVYCTEANEQTFYYSNMSPQLNRFNGGFWGRLEARVQAWGRSCPATYDNVFVAKGGTLNHLLIDYQGLYADTNGYYPTTDGNGFTTNGLACPQYYFMAVLSKKGDSYHAIGFLVEHSETLTSNPNSDLLKSYAISIDELEEETGLDFFCNLPDVIEDGVEVSCNVNDWAW